MTTVVSKQSLFSGLRIVFLLSILSNLYVEVMDAQIWRRWFYLLPRDVGGSILVWLIEFTLWKLFQIPLIKKVVTFSGSFGCWVLLAIIVCFWCFSIIAKYPYESSYQRKIVSLMSGRLFLQLYGCFASLLGWLFHFLHVEIVMLYAINVVERQAL